MFLCELHTLLHGHTSDVRLVLHTIFGVKVTDLTELRPTLIHRDLHHIGLWRRILSLLSSLINMFTA